MILFIILIILWSVHIYINVIAHSFRPVHSMLTLEKYLAERVGLQVDSTLVILGLGHWSISLYIYVL